jgi:hypothetical protein
VRHSSRAGAHRRGDRRGPVVEEGYSRVFKVDHVRPSVVADGIAECQIRFPTGPLVFCETRKLAQEWTYRFLAAAQVGLSEEMIGGIAVRALEAAPALAPAPPAPVDVRRWAFANDIVVSGRGRSPSAVMDRYLEARARGRSEDAVVCDCRRPMTGGLGLGSV